MAELYKDRLLLLTAEALAVTLQTIAHHCIVFPNEESLYRHTLSLMENALSDKDNPLNLNEKQIQEFEKYYLDIAEAVSYGMIVKEDEKCAANH